MNRRGFLSLLAPAAALIVAPELLLPKRTFFLPPAGGWGHYTATDVLMDYAAYWERAIRAYNPPVMHVNEAWLADRIEFANSKLAEVLAPGLVYSGPGFFRPLT